MSESGRPRDRAFGDEAFRLERLRSYRILDTPREAEFDRLVFMAAQLFRVPIALISLVDDRRQWFKARVGWDVEETSREAGFCTHTIEAGQLLVVEDARLDPRFATSTVVVGEPFVRFYAGVPLADREGVRLGAFCVIDQRTRQMGEADRRTLRQLGHETMQLLERRRLH